VAFVQVQQLRLQILRLADELVVLKHGFFMQLDYPIVFLVDLSVYHLVFHVRFSELFMCHVLDLLDCLQLGCYGHFLYVRLL